MEGGEPALAAPPGTLARPDPKGPKERATDIGKEGRPERCRRGARPKEKQQRRRWLGRVMERRVTRVGGEDTVCGRSEQATENFFSVFAGFDRDVLRARLNSACVGWRRARG
jgi:hypothetical protein